MREREDTQLKEKEVDLKEKKRELPKSAVTHTVGKAGSAAFQTAKRLRVDENEEIAPEKDLMRAAGKRSLSAFRATGNAAVSGAEKVRGKRNEKKKDFSLKEKNITPDTVIQKASLKKNEKLDSVKEKRLDKLRGRKDGSKRPVRNKTIRNKTIRNKIRGEEPDNGIDIVTKMMKKAAKTTVRAVAAVVAAFPILIPIAVIAVILISCITMIFGSTLTVMEEEEKNTRYASNNPASQTEVYIWNTLMEYFEGDEIPVLGVMCNIQAESGFVANNLENTVVDRWKLTDKEYTTLINSGEITKEDFMTATYNGDSVGYDAGGYWVNNAGGYGLFQLTDYLEKKRYYEFAEKYFDEKNEIFDIGSSAAQMEYIKYYLDDLNPDLKSKLVNAESVEAAVEIWVREYERPADIEKEVSARAQTASQIRAACMYSGEYMEAVAGVVEGPRLYSAGTQLTWEFVNAHPDWYGITSPYGVGYSIQGHGGNCTSYVYGRRCELEGGSTDIGQGSWRWDAGTFYDDAVAQGIYETGRSPRPGAIAVWQGGGSSNKHVAIVAVVECDDEGNITKIITENSGWNGPTLFYNVVFSSEQELINSNPEFKGYIYLERKGELGEEE